MRKFRHFARRTYEFYCFAACLLTQSQSINWMELYNHNRTIEPGSHEQFVEELIFLFGSWYLLLCPFRCSKFSRYFFLLYSINFQCSLLCSHISCASCICLQHEIAVGSLFSPFPEIYTCRSFMYFFFGKFVLPRRLLSGTMNKKRTKANDNSYRGNAVLLRHTNLWTSAGILVCSKFTAWNIAILNVCWCNLSVVIAGFKVLHVYLL